MKKKINRNLKINFKIISIQINSLKIINLKIKPHLNKKNNLINKLKNNNKINRQN